MAKRAPDFWQRMAIAFGVILIVPIFVWGDGARAVKPPADAPQRASLSGVYLCLPENNRVRPPRECVQGIKADDGSYYALDLGLSSRTPPALRAGDRISANGLFTPAEALSSDRWRKYPIRGIFSVTDSLQKH